MVTARTIRSLWSSRYSSVLQFTVLVAVLIWFTARGAAGIHYNWQWYRVPEFLLREVNGQLLLGPLLKGLLVTLDITWKSLVAALVIGLATALLRLSDSIVGRALSRAYLELIRNTPLLVQLYIFYFILAPLFDLDRYFTGIMALAIFEGAYVSEIMRAGILAISRGQWEAANGLGLSKFATYRWIVLPQALRLVLPPLASQAIATIKSSAMLSVIAIFELANEGRAVIADTFMTFEIWLTVAAIYWLVTLVLSLCVTALERRLRIAT